MAYIALYRKWRPLVFEDVVEQEHVVRTLKNSVVTGRIAHAYLFCGTRGTGKTTMAKIFSRAINCLNPKDGDPCNECEVCKGILSQNILDVVEIDAASNNSVDNVREIRDEVIYAPSQAKYKVYIIDEVHMLSTGAFNALLKTLEEPPAHVVFILATTEPHKLPATILSRCQRFDFRRISIESIMDRLNSISIAGGVTAQTEALRLIARLSDGALRDAISILDQCMGLGNKEINYNDVLNVVGIVNDMFMSQVVDTINSKKINEMMRLVDQLVMNGKDITQFVSDMVYYYRNLLICKITDNPREIIDAGLEAVDTMKRQASELSQDEIMQVIKELSLLEASLKWATHPRILLEVSLMKLCKNSVSLDSGNIVGRLEAIEEKIKNGAVISSSPVKEKAESIKKAEITAENRNPKTPSPGYKEQNQSGSVGSLKVLQVWDKVLESLKKSGRMAVFTNLIGSKAIEIDDRIIGIVFPGSGSFAKMMVSKTENIEVVEAVLKDLLGRDIRVKCYNEDEVPSNTNKPQKEEKDDFVERAQEIAKRINAPLNIIDE